jgi:RNA polymerase sigma factor (sigma-70 family)
MRNDFSIPDDEQPMVEPGLAPALASLSERQRLVVVMVHALGWTHRETAEFLGLSTSSVQKHLERGLSRLRHSLGVEVDA